MASDGSPPSNCASAIGFANIGASLLALLTLLTRLKRLTGVAGVAGLTRAIDGATDTARMALATKVTRIPGTLLLRMTNSTLTLATAATYSTKNVGFLSRHYGAPLQALRN